MDDRISYSQHYLRYAHYWLLLIAFNFLFFYKLVKENYQQNFKDADLSLNLGSIIYDFFMSLGKLIRNFETQFVLLYNVQWYCPAPESWGLNIIMHVHCCVPGTW